nr:replication protein A 70 kDa DNA-binding subunit B-like [Ipomoea batatas]
MSCSKCDHSWHEGTVKYWVVVREMDSTCDAPLLIWDKECYDLIWLVFQLHVLERSMLRIGLADFEMVGFDEVVYLEVLGAH